MKREEAEAIAWKHCAGCSYCGDVDGGANAILEAVEIQKQRDAELCRRLQVESRKRVELGFTCAKAIEEQDND